MLMGADYVTVITFFCKITLQSKANIGSFITVLPYFEGSTSRETGRDVTIFYTHDGCISYIQRCNSYIF